MIELNKVYNEDCLITMSKIKDKSVNLIIADFPYFEVKGEFDFIWKDFSEFLEWVEVCAKEFKRILSDNGSLYVYGHAKKIAYKQIVFDKYFNLENHLKWLKTDCQTRIGYQEFKSYPPVTEHILFYSNEVGMTGLEAISNDLELYTPIRNYFKEQRSLTNLSYKEINEKCFNTASNGGGMASNILTSYKNGWTFPTQEKYEALQKIGICKRDYEVLRNEYEKLRAEYFGLIEGIESKRRPFNNIYRKDDVIALAQDVHITGEYKHPTQKTPKLSRILIETSSRENDLVYIPFGGSGTELEQCQILNRKYIGSEIESKYYEIILDRLKNAKGEVGLFSDEIIQKGLFDAN